MRSSIEISFHSDAENLVSLDQGRESSVPKIVELWNWLVSKEGGDIRRKVRAAGGGSVIFHLAENVLPEPLEFTISESHPKKPKRSAKKPARSKRRR